ncbi:hypothetical protein GCM10009854_09300 [Saccharopolyspora halophila]|uniref:Uncharacterized protein n=1 Tax=Saccharopolyspora halophila TaxID=405551 RepID=A0ABP5SP41_9PSEU
MERDPEAVLSAALRARAGGRSGTARFAPGRGPEVTWGLLFAALLGLLAGVVAASVTVLYPLG